MKRKREIGVCLFLKGPGLGATNVGMNPCSFTASAHCITSLPYSAHLMCSIQYRPIMEIKWHVQVPLWLTQRLCLLFGNYKYDSGNNFLQERNELTKKKQVAPLECAPVWLQTLCQGYNKSSMVIIEVLSYQHLNKYIFKILLFMFLQVIGSALPWAQFYSKNNTLSMEFTC